MPGTLSDTPGDALEPIDLPDAVLSRLRAARSVLVLTGAGISAESGIPTFRAPGTGLWSQYRIEDFATPDAWRRNPQLVWSWYAHRRRLAQRAQPNAGHLALAELAAYYPDFTLVTQNVDGLHTRAGNKGVIELHGSLQRFRCSRDDRPVAYTDPDDNNPAALAALEAGELLDVPRCPDCGALVRPDIVWFGEALPLHDFARAEDAARACQVCFVVGTSAIVYPAAALPETARKAGALIVEINPEETELTPYADLSLRGPAGVVLPQLVARITQNAQEDGKH